MHVPVVQMLDTLLEIELLELVWDDTKDDTHVPVVQALDTLLDDWLVDVAGTEY